ncbi:MAG TPA: PVC-type heme-binding CxxCH protein [Gemmataceae bacterium]|nr:PVC-type heme-binding CxxCH protein [Gemmataceae bacterium]
MTLRRTAAVLFLVVLAALAVLRAAPDADYSDQLPRIPPLSLADAVKAIQTRLGFHVELVAAEPLIESPVAIDFDENGRMFVVEFPEYNQNFNRNFHVHGAVRLLEDTQGTGHYDKSTLYLDDIDSPLAVACWDGGVYVGAAPNILYCKDTKGDGHADLRRPVYTGFGSDESGEGRLNSFRWGLDNRFHVSTGLVGGNVRPADDPAARPVSVRGQNLLFDPRNDGRGGVAPPSGTGGVTPPLLTSGGGQHGMSMDDWGRTFTCGNSDPVNLLMYDRRYVARNPYLQPPVASVNIAPDGKYTKLYRISAVEPWRKLRTRLRTEGVVPGSDEGGQPSGFFTGATGVTVYRGDAYPAEYRDNVFVGEVANNLVYRARLEPDGVGLKAVRADAGVEFLASRDDWFRPVQFANGPDGCLYVIDMPRETIETVFSLPPQILKHLDVSAGVEKGRIWRIVPDGFKQPKIPKLGEATTAELVALLEHPNGWHRDTASRLLYQRQDKTAVAPLKKMAAESKAALGRVQALYALDGLKALDGPTVLHALGDDDPHVREQAVRLAETFAAEPDIRDRLTKMTDDADLRVRYQLAFSLGECKGDEATQALARLAHHDGSDSWFRLAILSSSADRAGDLFRLLLADKDLRGNESGRALLTELAGEIGAADRKTDTASALKAVENLPDGEKSLSRAIILALAFKQPAAARERLLRDDAKARALLDDLLQYARKTATDAMRDEAARSAAVRTLGLAPFGETRDLYRDLLHSDQPPQVSATALEVLGRYDQPEAAGLILDAWPMLSPALRKTAAETLFSRGAWVSAFLDAVADKKVQPADVDPARIKLLQSYPDAKVRERTAALFASAQLARRQDVVDDYQKALQLPSDATRGKAIFKRECSECHRLEGVGAQVGADLTAIHDWGSEKILLNVLDPNREVQPQFLTYVLTTKSGRVLTGMITAETANGVTIRRADQTSEMVARPEIDELRSTGLSFMPEGLEKRLTYQEMADLLAYLGAAK